MCRGVQKQQQNKCRIHWKINSRCTVKCIALSQLSHTLQKVVVIRSTGTNKIIKKKKAKTKKIQYISLFFWLNFTFWSDTIIRRRINTIDCQTIRDIFKIAWERGGSFFFSWNKKKEGKKKTKRGKKEVVRSEERGEGGGREIIESQRKSVLTR